jgi:uncharacterized protein (DUF2147 family)
LEDTVKKLLALAAVLIVTSTAQAGDSFSFQINGQSIHIDAPRDCTSASCISVSIPGVFEHNPKRKRKAATPDTEVRATPPADPEQQPAASAKAAPAAPVVASPAPVATPVPALAPQTSQSLEPANGTPVTTTSTPLEPASSAPPAAATVVATAPVAPAVQQQQTQPARPVIFDNSPIGIWMTEKKEGKVRIEACGSNLCGYSINAKTNANGEKVLINMKPGSNKWTGRIYDPNSGSTYDSTIALKGPDSLRVQGCAFGGMFCGGQTWSRVN